MIYFFPFASSLLILLSLCFVAEMFHFILGSTLRGGCIVRLGFGGRSDASLLVFLLNSRFSTYLRKLPNLVQLFP